MTELTPERLLELRVLADAATPGPYGVESWLDPEFLERQWAIVVPEAPHSRMIAKVFGDNAVWLERGQFGENAHYFAALDPATVSELVAGYERAQRYETALREIELGAGPFSRDQLTHATNTVRHMQSLARMALESQP